MKEIKSKISESYKKNKELKKMCSFCSKCSMRSEGVIRMYGRDYWTCPYCGCNLDIGERCDCMDEIRNQNTEIMGEGELTRNQNFTRDISGLQSGRRKNKSGCKLITIGA